MADVQRIIDEVRFRLQSGNCELNDELKRLAGEYAGLCHAVNTRLRRCGDFLKQGLRAEAIQLADADPNLLDMFATVDFPERADWNQVASLYQLPAAEPLLADVAQDLNEAYSFQQPLEKLLDRHRLLALCRAPLGQRLAVVRKLAEADPDSRFWDDDVREFEVARCHEIETEARSAAAGNDDAALTSLLNETSSGAWRQMPPAGVVQLVKKLAQQAIADQLQAAFVSRNLDRGRMLRDQWQALVPRSSSAGNGAAGPVAAALKWLAAEDSKSQALQSQYAKLENLERMLGERDSSLAELERARKDLLKSGRDIPAHISVRLDTRVRSLRDQARTSRRRTAAIVLAGTALFVGLFAFMIWSSLRYSAATRIANSAEQLVVQGNLRQARELLDTNSSWMSTTEQYLAAHAKLVEAEQKDAVRAGNFRAAIERARSAATAPLAEAAIAEADRLAVSSDEQRLVDDVKGRVSRMTQETALNDDNRFQQQLSEATDLLDRLEQLQEKSAADAAFADLLKIAETKCRELRQTAARVKPALALHVDAAEARLARIRKTASNADRRTGLLERLTAESAAIAGAADPDPRVRQFCQTLNEFGDAFPSDPRSANFAKAAAEVDLWRGILRWQLLAKQWKTLVPRSVKEARARSGECNAWLGEHAATPAGAVLRDYLTFLGSVIAREEDSSGDQKEGLHQKLLELFSGPLVEDVEMFVTAGGERYYMRDKYEWAEGRPLKYIAGVRGEQKSVTIKKAEVNAPKSREAPQSVLRRKVREIMARATFSTWDEALQSIAETLRSDRELDPFLRYYFLLRVLDFASEGNSILAVELGPIVTELKGAAVKLSAKWMDPKDGDADTARKNAQRALTSLSALKVPFDRAASRSQELSRQIFEQATPVGWLGTDQHGRWECLAAAGAKLKPGATLWMAVPPTGDQPVASWIKVGDRTAGGLLTIAPESKTHLVQGRLLFTRDGLEPGARGNGK